MNFKPYRVLSAVTLTLVIGFGVWNSPQAALAKDKQQDPQGCHTTPIPVPEPGWLTLLAAGAAPVVFSIKRRLRPGR